VPVLSATFWPEPKDPHAQAVLYNAFCVKIPHQAAREGTRQLRPGAVRAQALLAMTNS